jgi:hypothetical protein
MNDEYWCIVVDRGDGKETLIHEGNDIDKVYTRIGQMVLSLGIEQIVVYRNGEEYRRYALSSQIMHQTGIQNAPDGR